MELELLLSNDRRALPSVRGLLTEALRQLPLDSELAGKLEQLAVQTVTDAIHHAYPAGEEGSIRLSVREKLGKLEILVRDYGLPQDVAALERQIHQPRTTDVSQLVADVMKSVDEVHWLSYGRDGKAFQIIKWLHDAHIADSAASSRLEAFHENAPLAPDQKYEIRRLRPEEAVQISQLMYRAYGNTYFNEDVYYPDRIVALNARNAVLSFVAVGEDGTVAGHYAVELDQPGPVAEGGQAVVDPAHRGRGLLERLKAAALQAAQELNLTGWYADAVAVHTLTQKSDVTHGGHLTAVDLAISPRTESFKNIADRQPQRVTCMLYFHWLKSPQPRAVSVPERHREMVSTIYDRLGCPLTFLGSESPAGHGTLSVKSNAGGGTAFLRADQLGGDTVRSIAHATRELVERSHIEAVFAELPLPCPATAFVAEELERSGFGFIGIAPHFSPNGDLLRMVYLVEPLQREPIKMYEDFAGKLVDYVLAEQMRVQTLI